MSKRNKETIEQKIVIGFFRGIWWLVTLPFKGLRRKKQLNLEDKKYIILKRQEIESYLKSENHLELRHAVFEADKLVDFVLKKRNYHGETFADRLRSAEKFTTPAVYNNIWQAHKVRNQIAHEDNAAISNQTLKNAINLFLVCLRSI